MENLIATRQQLTILCACRGGLISAWSGNKNLPPKFKDDLFEADRLLDNAVKKWGVRQVDEDICVNLLKLFAVSLEATGLGKVADLTTMIAVTQQALDTLMENCPKDKLRFLIPIAPLINRLGAHLHEGMKDKGLVQKFSTADQILERLFMITGFVSA